MHIFLEKRSKDYLYLKESLSCIHPFKVELEGFSKQEDRYGNYLFLKGENIYGKYVI